MKPTFNRLSRLSQIALAVVTVTAGTGMAASDNWSADANGNWNDTTKWLSGTQYPSVLGDIATLGGGSPIVPITLQRTITLNTAATVSGLTFDNRGSTSYTLPNNSVEFSNSGYSLQLGSQILTLDTGTAGFDVADLVVIEQPTTNLTGHTISGGVGRLNFVDNVEIRTNTTTNPDALGGNVAHYRDNRVELSIGNALSGSGNLTKTGRGQVLLASDSAAYSGTIRIGQGLVQARGNNTGPSVGNLAFGTGSVVLTNGLATSTVIPPVPQGIEMDGAQLGLNNYSNTNGLGDPVFANALVLEATNATRDFSIAPNACNFTWSGNISNTGALPANLSISGAGRAASWGILTGDNSGLSFASGKRLWVTSMYIGVGNANALGLGNNQPVRLSGGAFQSGLVATIATTVASDIIVDSRANQAPSVVGGNITSGTVTFNTGGLKFNQDNSTGLRNNFLRSKTGGTVVFDNVISSGGANGSPVYKDGGGVVEINGTNTYTGLSGVRSGSLVLGNNSALGGSTSAVSLGQPTIAVANVKAASITGLGTFTTTNGGTLTGAGTSLDGIALFVGDRVLVKDDGTSSTAFRNGIYEVISSGTWQRVAELNESAELLYGIQVSVTSGNNNAGKTFFQSMGVPGTAGVLNTDGLSFMEGDVINPDAAILLKNGITLSREINVVANSSTGKSILGGNGNGASTLSGTVNLGRDLTVTAASGGTATFSGDIAGFNAVTKEGSGTVVFSTAKGYSGATTVAAGLLEVNGTLASNGVTVNSGATLQGVGIINKGITVSGTLAPGNATIGTLTAGLSATFNAGGVLKIRVDGTGAGSADRLTLMTAAALDITQATLNLNALTALDDPAYVIASYDTLTGSSFAGLVGLPAGYILDYTYNGGPQIALVPGSYYDVWAAGYTFANPPVDSLATADPDGDGLVNQQEYAFGLNPTLGSSANPITVPFDKSTGTFTYTRRKQGMTGLSYTILTSTTLGAGSWTTDAASQTLIGTVGNIETVQVTVSPALLANPKLFVRVVAQ